MGFSLGFGSKKSKGSTKNVTDFNVSEDSTTTAIQNAIKQASSTLTSAEQQTLSSLMQSMGITNSLTEQTQQQNTQQSTTGLEQTQQSLQGAEQQNVATSQFAEQDLAKIRELIPGVFAQAQQNYNVASGANLPQQIAAIQRQLSEATLPQIMSQEAGAGAYNMSSTQQLANDAIARGAELAANLQVQAATQSGQALSPVMQLADILKGAQTTQQGTTQNSQTATGTTQTSQQVAIQQLLQALTSQQQTQQNTQQTDSTQNTTGTQTQTTAESDRTQSTEKTNTEQEGTSTSQKKSKGKESGFSIGFG